MRILLVALLPLFVAGTAVTAAAASAANQSAPPPAKPPSPLANLVPASPYEADIIAHPEDFAALGSHAHLLFNQASASDDETRAPELRRKARAFAAAALQAGSKSLLLRLLLEQTREDGSLVELPHSSRADADRLIQQGEKLFARGEFDGALKSYAEALKLDPKSHHAAVFAGDVYFVNKDYPAAIEWFDRAIAIDPLNETAHRYRADALMHLRRFEEARDSYIAAVLASPYNGLPREALRSWAAQRKTPFAMPDASFPRGSLSFQNGEAHLELEPDFAALSLAYVTARAEFVTSRDKRPAAYRHSLDEEAHALRTVLKIADELRSAPQSADELAKHSDALQLLRRLDRERLLEPHILFDRADAGIAQDYPAFHRTHRDLLVRYIREIWLAGK